MALYPALNFLQRKKISKSMFDLLIFWHSHRESNPELALRRGLLYPFNYGSILLSCVLEDRTSPLACLAEQARLANAVAHRATYPFNYGSKLLSCVLGDRTSPLACLAEQAKLAKAVGYADLSI